MSGGTNGSARLVSSSTVCADLLGAQTDRWNGYQGRSARDVLRDMEQAIVQVETRELDCRQDNAKYQSKKG